MLNWNDEVENKVYDFLLQKFSFEKRNTSETPKTLNFVIAQNLTKISMLIVSPLNSQPSPKKQVCWKRDKMEQAKNRRKRG